MTRKKVYLAHPISTTGEFNDSKRIAGEIRELGYDVYAAAENDSINDKSNNPTPVDIYHGDVSEILKCDYFVVNITGALQDGTISEIGMVAGINEARDLMGIGEFIPIIAYTSSSRLRKPQTHLGIPSASANHLVLGMVECWGTFSGSESDMIYDLVVAKEWS